MNHNNHAMKALKERYQKCTENKAKRQGIFLDELSLSVPEPNEQLEAILSVLYKQTQNYEIFPDNKFINQFVVTSTGQFTFIEKQVTVIDKDKAIVFFIDCFGYHYSKVQYVKIESKIFIEAHLKLSKSGWYRSKNTYLFSNDPGTRLDSSLNKLNSYLTRSDQIL